MNDTTELAAVLIVDDHPDNLLALEGLLADLCRPMRASSGAEALRHLLTNEVAAILLDVNMPLMDGFETAALIQQRAKYVQTPIIFMSASFTSEQYTSRGYRQGAVDYLLTPIIPEVLRAKITVFCDLFKLRKNAVAQAQRLWEINQKLEAEIKARRQAETEVSRYNLALKEANSELAAFSYSVSHDLKAPLRAIEGFSRLLLENYAAVMDDQACNYLKNIESASQGMARIIEALLMLSGLTRANLRRRQTDFSALAEEIARELRESEPNRHVEFVIAAGLTVWGDKSFLRQALANLMGNAWKFTQNLSPARIEVGVCRQNGEIVYFVQDNGAGFPPALVAKMFEPFQRFHTAAQFPGTGIGLALVKRIINRHGGRVWAIGEEGKGATFYFTLSPAETGQAVS